ncbi:MAG: tRNA ((37)-N6)-threonylcarbamoyltransferase complex ATPase subunit type 1 TsaE [Microbacteriaceae bacterium]|nr:tRNA ((37)-N6)-threonylcarbamoyltransferase complex ATPase subunit type 1 TsaE [Microbacteriaceae bacterium]
MQLRIDSPEQMAELGARLATKVRAGDLIALNGELGAGKTTMTRGLGERLGVRGAVTSPTFVLARTHERLDSGPPLVHVDAYRLGGPAELDDLDIDFDASIVVVEWAAGMLDGVTEDWLEISIERPTGAASPRAAFAGAAPTGIDGDELVEPRTVTITGHGERWLDLRLD